MKKINVKERIGNQANKPEKKRISIKMALYLFSVAFLIVLSVFNYAKLNELTFEQAKIQSETKLLESDIVRLNVELNKKTDISTVEEKAKELGMVKTDSSNVKYVSIPAEDKIDSPQEDEGFLSSIVKGLSVIMEYFS